MKVVSYGKTIQEPVTIALGFFDCVHSGHRQLIKSAKSLADKRGVKLCVFTFSNSPCPQKSKVVNTFAERASMLEELGANFLLHARFDESFSNKTPQQFLAELSDFCNLEGIVCGFDYRFGSKALGDAKMLKEFCAKNAIEFQMQQQVVFEGQKISTTLIKEFLQNGNIEDSNRCLGYTYFLEGYVNVGHGKGRTLGFSTANVDVEEDKFLPQAGVYLGVATVNDKNFDCVINVGCRPTFKDACVAVEAHILGFCDDIYFQKIRLSFKRYLRPLREFPSEKELAQQIAADIEEVKNAR